MLEANRIFSTENSKMSGQFRKTLKGHREQGLKMRALVSSKETVMSKNSKGPRIRQMDYEIKASRPYHQKQNKKMDLNILRNTKYSLTEL